MPGDTYKSFQKNFWDVMEQGLLENFQTPYFQKIVDDVLNVWQICNIGRTILFQRFSLLKYPCSKQRNKSWDSRFNLQSYAGKILFFRPILLNFLLSTSSFITSTFSPISGSVLLVTLVMSRTIVFSSTILGMDTPKKGMEESLGI